MLEVFGLSLLCAVILFFPGYFLCRGFKLSRFISFGVAPVVTSAMVGVVCVALPFAGVSASWTTVFLPCLVIAVVLFLASQALKSVQVVSFGLEDDGFGLLGFAARKSNWICAILSIVVAVILGCVFFLTSLGSPDVFLQRFDNASHLNSIYNNLQSGNWSSLQGSFYPSAWRDIVSLLCSMTSISVAEAENVANFAFSFVVFPAGIVLLARMLLGNRPYAVLFSGLFATGIAAFPWNLITFGPIYPNLAAVACLPGAMALFMALFDAPFKNGGRIRTIVIFVVAAVGLALLQPNTIFSAFVFFAPYLVVRSTRLAAVFKRDTWPVKTVIGVVATVIIVVAWLAVYKSSFVAAVLSEPGIVFYTFKDACIRAVLLSFLNGAPQVVLTLLCLVGVLCTCKHRGLLWLSVVLVIDLFSFALSASGEYDLLREIFSGFWYNDAYRLAANTVVAAIPLCALGFDAVARKGIKLLRAEDGAKRAATVGVLFLICFVGNYLPNIASFQTPFGKVAARNAECFSTTVPNVLNTEEKEFVSKAMEITGKDALVVNVPDDGSVFARGLDGMHVLYENTRIWSPETESTSSKLIRTKLCDYATDPDVQQAVEDTDAQYVLVLDKGAKVENSSGSEWLFTWYWYSDWWDGIMGIDDDTPGFEVVLAQDDMRLYKIVR